MPTSSESPQIFLGIYELKAETMQIRSAPVRDVTPTHLEKPFICALAERSSGAYDVLLDAPDNDGVLATKSIWKIATQLGGVVGYTCFDGVEAVDANASLWVLPHDPYKPYNHDPYEPYNREADSPRFRIYIDRGKSYKDSMYGQRYAIAHELAHYLLHYKFYNRYKGIEPNENEKRFFTKSVQREDAEIRKNNSQKMRAFYTPATLSERLTDEVREAEVEADNFAMCFLMPSKIFKSHWKQCVEEGDPKLHKEFCELFPKGWRQVAKGNEQKYKEYTDKAEKLFEKSLASKELAKLFQVSNGRLIGRAICLEMYN